MKSKKTTELLKAEISLLTIKVSGAKSDYAPTSSYKPYTSVPKDSVQSEIQASKSKADDLLVGHTVVPQDVMLSKAEMSCP